MVTRSPGLQRVTRTKLAVLGSPIAHSKSPLLHRAAYEVLGVPWSYEAIDVTSANLGTFVSSRREEWRGLSLTMPLKREIVPMLDSLDETAALTGAVNTVLFGEDALTGFNTDVAGLMQPLQDAGTSQPTHVLILGAGATAGSALTAAVRLGASSITIAARDVQKAQTMRGLAQAQGAWIEISSLEDISDIDADVVINTVPGGAAAELHFTARQRRASVLFDVIYDPWPSVLASRWSENGGRVIPGIEMLLAQALRQVRLFFGGDADMTVPKESDVIAAMRASVGAPSRQ